MIHVPDVRATVDRYTSIEFALVRQHEEDGEINWAKLSFGNSELVLNIGGKASTNHRREVNLYITTDNADDLYRHLKDRVQVVQDLMAPSTACGSSLFATAAASRSLSASLCKRSCRASLLRHALNASADAK